MFDNYLLKSGIWITSEDSTEPYFIRKNGGKTKIGKGTKQELVSVKKTNLPPAFLADLIAKFINFGIDITVNSGNFRQVLIDHYGTKKDLSPNTKRFKATKAELLAAIEKMAPNEVESTLDYVKSGEPNRKKPRS